MAEASKRIHTFLVLKAPGAPDRLIVWDTQEITLGRSEENDLALDYGEISRRHAYFMRDGGSYAVQNLNTSNGTLVNGQEIKTRTLQSRDLIQVAEVEISFYQSHKDPVSLGMKVEFASQLKEFAGPAVSGDNAEATMLGLLEPVGDSDEDFQVRSAGDFAYDLHDMGNELDRAPVTRDLDDEIGDFGLDDLDISNTPPESEAPVQAKAPQSGGAASASGTLSLTLEIQGLEGDLRRVLKSVMGKTLSLPSLKIRIKGDDLG